MKKILLLSAFFMGSCMPICLACNCGPAISENSLDEKVYSGENYVFFTAEIMEVESAFHLEVTLTIQEIFYGSTYVKDISKPVTIYFDQKTECAILHTGHIVAGTQLFITTVYNSMGRMFITNQCDAYFPVADLETYHLRAYLDGLKKLH
jgi:hypothetical protein